jgi:hypothetical protein
MGLSETIANEEGMTMFMEMHYDESTGMLMDMSALMKYPGVMNFDMSSGLSVFTETISFPTFAPTDAPSVAPSIAPTLIPTAPPTNAPTATPSIAPSAIPTVPPTYAPTAPPSDTPTYMPSYSMAPTTTSAPTRRPTKMPTIAPTLAPAITQYPTVTPTKGTEIYFYVAQTLSGIDSATFIANQDVNEKALKRSIAACMTGIVEDDITNLVISDVTTVRHLSMRGVVGSPNIELNSASSVKVSYYVTKSSSAYSYSDLLTELNSKIASGDFTAILSDASADLGADLIGITAEPATAVDLQVDSSAVKKALAQLFIIIIAVVGSVVVICLFAVILFCCVLNRRSGKTISPRAVAIEGTKGINAENAEFGNQQQIVVKGNHNEASL